MCVCVCIHLHINFFVASKHGIVHTHTHTASPSKISYERNTYKGPMGTDNRVGIDGGQGQKVNRAGESNGGKTGTTVIE